MKKLFALFTALVMTATMLGGTGTSAFASPGAKDDSGGHVCRTECAKWGIKDGEYHIHPKVKFNGQTMTFEDVEPVIINGSTLVPLRAIFETLGASVEWVESTQTIISNKAGKTITLQIGKNVATVDGVQKPLNVAPQTIGDRTMVPLRFVSESLGADVTFNSATNVVEINQGAVPVTPTPAPSQPTPAPTPSSSAKAMSPMEYAAYLTKIFGEVKTSIGVFRVSLDFGSNSDGKLFVIGNINPDDYTNYLANYHTIESDLKTWSSNVGADFNKNFPGVVGGVGIYYQDTYPFYPKSFSASEIEYASGGKWKVTHRLFGVFIFDSGNVVKVNF